MQRVLLTGATGFIGRHCVPRLASRGLEVHAVSSRPPAEAAEGIVWHRADLLDETQVGDLAAAARATHLLHLAWHTRPGDLYGSPANQRWADAGLALLRAAGEHGLERAAVAGSCAEYDWRDVAGDLAEEGSPLAPQSEYGRAKLRLSGLAREWAGSAGVSLVWPRIFFLYGPGEDRRRLVPAVITALLAGEEAQLTHGRQVRDYLYVEDAAQLLVDLLAAAVEGPVNVGSGRPVTVAEIAAEAARQLDGQGLVRLGARPAPAGEPPRLVADVGRLTRALGWRPATSLTEGLARTIRWWRGVGATA
ncbi:MAG: NAD(P)-dependent oxidoreductase [Thermoanaerobaculia bacterium]|nr:NAD(P)-dependent oxidoreductase [Thermoanaerobaculia bacterium]